MVPHVLPMIQRTGFDNADIRGTLPKLAIDAPNDR